MYKMTVLGYDIIDHCNLNCRNCSHFSQFKDKHEKSIEEIEKDLLVLSSKIEIKRFKLEGGEPLIHSDIKNVLITVRKIIGNNTKITLGTNGIKFLSMPDEFFTILKYLQIIPKITKYPINTDYDAIESKLKDKKIPYGPLFDKTNFHEYPDPTGTQDPIESFRLCQSDGVCPSYCNERLYACCYTFNVPFINQHFNYKIETNSVSIHAPVEIINKYMNSPCLTCRFCKCTRVIKPWMLQRDEVKTILTN